MNKSWRFFIVIECLFALLAIWQIINNYLVIVMLGIGLFLMVLSQNNVSETKPKNIKRMIGLTLIFFSLLNIPAVWFMLIFAIIFIGLTGLELSGLPLSNSPFQLRKKMMIVETMEPRNKNGRLEKQQLFGNKRLGSQIYEWDDINLTIASGDTIIDLGNTILPKGKNVIVLRKGFGRTRILVPHGIQIDILHEAFRGEFHFQQYHYSLNAEEVKIHDMKYAESERKIKIISNVIMGDLEVIRV